MRKVEKRNQFFIVSNISLVSDSLQNLAVDIFEDYFLLYLNGVLTYQVQMSKSMEFNFYY